MANKPLVLVIDEAHHALTGSPRRMAIAALRVTKDDLSEFDEIKLRLLMIGSDRQRLRRLAQALHGNHYDVRVSPLPPLQDAFVQQIAVDIAREHLSDAPLDVKHLIAAFTLFDRRPGLFIDAITRVLNQLSVASDAHGTAVGSHHLSIEPQTRRWVGRIVAGSDDILCTSRAEFDQGLKQQGLLALYNESGHRDLTKSITGSPYATFRQPSYRPVDTRRLFYHQHCDDCQASGTQTCPTCRGERETSCSSCSGDGNEMCSSCGGSGQQEVGHNDSDGHHRYEWANCPGCHGIGHVHCGSCGGSGYETCGTCHRTGAVPCAPCEGTGSFTEIGQVSLLHTPTYQVTFDDGTPNSCAHVLNFFGHAGLAEPATVILESINRVDDTPATATLEFRYRFQLPAAQLKVKSRREILGSGDYSQWSVVGKTPEVIDCDHALFPLLMGASIDLQRMTGWRSAWRPSYNQRVSGELSTVLKPAVHQWIVDAVTRNRSVEEIEIEIRRALDPLSIAAIASNVTHALKTTYRRCMVLHQGAAMLITLMCMLMTSETSNRFTHGLLAGLPNQGIALRVRTGLAAASTDGAPWVFLAAIAILVIISFHVRHRAWLRRAGGDVLWARAKGLGQLNLRAVSLQILGAMLLVALLTQAVMTGR